VVLPGRVALTRVLVGVRPSIREGQGGQYRAYPATCPWFWKRIVHIGVYTTTISDPGAGWAISSASVDKRNLKGYIT